MKCISRSFPVNPSNEKFPYCKMGPGEGHYGFAICTGDCSLPTIILLFTVSLEVGGRAKGNTLFFSVRVLKLCHMSKIFVEYFHEQLKILEIKDLCK